MQTFKILKKERLDSINAIAGEGTYKEEDFTSGAFFAIIEDGEILALSHVKYIFQDPTTTLSGKIGLERALPELQAILTKATLEEYRKELPIRRLIKKMQRAMRLMGFERYLTHCGRDNINHLKSIMDYNNSFENKKFRSIIIKDANEDSELEPVFIAETTLAGIYHPPLSDMFFVVGSSENEKIKRYLKNRIFVFKIDKSPKNTDNPYELFFC